MSESVDFQDKIIQRIKKLRMDEGISQSKLSKILGISRGQVSNIENPNYPHKYTLKQIDILCKNFNYPIEKIFIPDVNIAPECSKAIEILVRNVIKYEG